MYTLLLHANISVLLHTFCFNSHLHYPLTIYFCICLNTFAIFVQVRRWGYFRFDNFSSGYVAPFWPYRGYWGGLLNYEIHTADTSELLLASIDSIINEEMGTDFHGEWLLIAKWDSIPESFGISNIVSL